MRGTRGIHKANNVSNADRLYVRGSKPPEGVELVREWPPRRAEIEDKFGQLPDGVIFAWGDKIMVPGGRPLEQWLIDHEAVHLQQQEDFGGVDEWWDRYLADGRWRLSQELEAHHAEWLSYCRHVKDRNSKARYLHVLAARLSSKMYGAMCGRSDAMMMIKSGRML